MKVKDKQGKHAWDTAEDYELIWHRERTKSQISYLEEKVKALTQENHFLKTGTRIQILEPQVAVLTEEKNLLMAENDLEHTPQSPTPVPIVDPNEAYLGAAVSSASE